MKPNPGNEPKPDDAVQPLLVSRAEVARLLGISPRTFDRLERTGKIGPRPVKLGGSVGFNFDELTLWAASGELGKLPTRQEWLRKE